MERFPDQDQPTSATQTLSRIAGVFQDQMRACLGLEGGLPELCVPTRVYGSPFPVDSLVTASVAVTLEAAAELAEARTGRHPRVDFSAAHAALAFQSERLLVPPAPLGPLMEPLSRFAPTRDGWIRLHANYPHHREALMRVLGHPSGVDSTLARIAEWDGVDLEDRLHEAGGAAAVVRSADGWRVHPQGRAAAGQPLLRVAPSDHPCGPLRSLPPGSPPCAGIRVLDLTRVISGPVATRMLVALGAEVLRLDSPQLPELRLHVLDGHIGKTSVMGDLGRPRHRAALQRMLEDIDLVVLGYRPGAMEPFGLEPSQLAVSHPWIGTVALSAWGDSGPWGHRRGFDSLVQAACGIATGCGSGDAPGALPVQALDHATGYLAAVAALRLLTHREVHGRAAHARLALVHTASLLLGHTVSETGGADLPDPSPFMRQMPTPEGGLGCLAPVGSVDGVQLEWPRGIQRPIEITEI